MEAKVHDRGKTVMITIMAVSLILPIPYFIVIQGLQISGIPAYLMQLGLYIVLYLLAFWGLRRNSLRLQVNSRLALEAIGLALISWLLYVASLQVLGAINLPNQLRALSSTPLGTALLRILMSWLFVGTGEEVLFRGTLLPGIRRFFTTGTDGRRTVVAILLSSAFFSIWHLPIRTMWLISGEIGAGLLLLSLLIVFVEGIGFAYLYVRTQNILLVGLVHGLVDLPLIGGNTQLSGIVLLFSIAIMEIARWAMRRTEGEALKTAH